MTRPENEMQREEERTFKASNKLNPGPKGSKWTWAFDPSRFYFYRPTPQFAHGSVFHFPLQNDAVVKELKSRDPSSRPNEEDEEDGEDDFIRNKGLAPPLVNVVSLASGDGGQEEGSDFFSEMPTDGTAQNLEYGFYRDTCPQAETVVRSKINRIYSQHRNVSAQLLRLFFHDCFVEGCDASVLLDDSNGNVNHAIEKQAVPNLSLKGFDKIDQIKGALEIVCPGVVSCADILTVATRDAIVLAGGPFYPIRTGRRDSIRSFFSKAMTGLPRPDDGIDQTLSQFSLRGLNERETVALLGAHNIGKIGCDFIKARLSNFRGTGQPDPTVHPEFVREMRLNCEDDNNRATTSSSPLVSRELSEKSVSKGMSYFQQLSSSVPAGGGFDTHYYQSLLKGKGLLFADQQLMANKRTARLVAAYASDDGSAFRLDFSRAMMKLADLNVLTGSQGQIRFDCSLPVLNS